MQNCISAFLNQSSARTKVTPVPNRQHYNNFIRCLDTSLNEIQANMEQGSHIVKHPQFKYGQYEQRHYSSQNFVHTTEDDPKITKTFTNEFSSIQRQRTTQQTFHNLVPGIDTADSRSLNLLASNTSLMSPCTFTTNVNGKEDSRETPQRTQFIDNQENIRYYQGTIERVIKWHKICKNMLCYYEVIASVISIQEGTVRLQKIMLLRDNRGPILQVVYYTTTYIDIENFHIGQKLRCVGRMLGNNIMHAIRIRTATDEDINYLQRHCYISDHAISNTLRLSN